MKAKAIRQSQMLSRVSTFGETHADRLLASAGGRAALAAVHDAMSALQRHACTQASARPRSGAHAKATVRRQLRARLQVVSRTARAIATEVPAFARPFRLPKSNGDAALLAGARGFAEHAAPVAATFVEFGLPPAFLDDLHAAIGAFRCASDQARAVRQAGVAATRAIDVVLAKARRAVCQLDVIVSNLYGDDPAALAAWQSARRGGRRRRRSNAAGEALVRVQPARPQLLPADATALVYSRVVLALLEMRRPV